MLGLAGVSLLTIVDRSNLLVAPGLWLATHRGPDFVIVLIFFFSGLALDTRQVRDGITDYTGTLQALALIFVAAPLLALAFSLLPLAAGTIIGLFLVAVMPSTLSSGVVMTGSAGGNMAHALLITIIANALAVFTIPVTLGLLLATTGDERIIKIDQLPIMIKIATLVLSPLLAGIFCRIGFGSRLRPALPYTAIANQLGILTMVWMALCSGKEAITGGLTTLVSVLTLVFCFHFVMILISLATTGIAGRPKGRRESIIFMGGQKTLPLSVILQVSLFPEYGIALVVCVVHHITHLVMDAMLIRYLLKKEE